MSSIPLPALQVKPPEQSNLLEQYRAMQQIKSGQQQQQIQQLAIQKAQQQQKDSLTVRDSFSKNKGDIDKTLQEVAGKVGADTYTALQQHAVDVKQKMSTLTADQLKNIATQNDNARGLIQPVIDAPAEKQAEMYAQSRVAALQNPQAYGITDPSQIPEQFPGADALKQQIAIHQGGKQQADEALKAAEKRKNEAQAKLDEAGIPGKQAEGQIKQAEAGMISQGGMNKEMADAKYLGLQTKAKSGFPIAPPDKAFMAAYEKQKTLNATTTFNLQNAGATGGGGKPSAIAQGIADGSIKWSDAVSPRTPMVVKAALLAEVKSIKPDFKSSDFEVEKKVQEKFTSGNAADQLTAINIAREHMSTFKQTAAALDNGNFKLANQVGNWLGTEFGSDKATNFNVARSAFAGEVGKAFAGANVGVSDRQELIDKINQSSSWSQLKGYADTADQLLAGKQKSLKQSYDEGKQGKPNFGNQSGGHVISVNGKKYQYKGSGATDDMGSYTEIK